MNWLFGFGYLLGGMVLVFCGSQMKDLWFSGAFLYSAGAIYLLMGLGYLFAALLSAKSKAHDRQTAKRKAEEQELRRQWPQVITSDPDEK
jgi:hypothetical protein